MSLTSNNNIDPQDFVPQDFDKKKNIDNKYKGVNFYDTTYHYDSSKQNTNSIIKIFIIIYQFLLCCLNVYILFNFNYVENSTLIIVSILDFLDIFFTNSKGFSTVFFFFIGALIVKGNLLSAICLSLVVENVIVYVLGTIILSTISIFQLFKKKEKNYVYYCPNCKFKKSSFREKCKNCGFELNNKEV